MARSRTHLVLLLLLACSLTATAHAATAPKPPAPAAPSASASLEDLFQDPDLPGALGGEVDKATYLRWRAEFMLKRFDDAPFDQIVAGRLAGVSQMRDQLSKQGPFISTSFWTAIGPAPIPNGQTTTNPTTVTGRVTAIAIHPSNPDLVYVGLAQGGVWKTTNGGASWTPMFDAQATIAIGALALAPSDPTILYVGTGEANGSADSFFGLGLYRIDQADTSPIVNGPFNPTPTTDIIGAKTFTGRAISRILVDAADPAIVFCSTTSGVGGLNAEAFGSTPPITGLRGIYRTTNGTSASPSFTKLTVSPAASIAPDVSGNQNIYDMEYDPSDGTGNTLVCWALGTTAVGNGGIYRTTDAKAPTPTFTQTFVTTVNNIRGAFASTMAGGVPSIYASTGETSTGTTCGVASSSGAIRVSLDGGVTWSAKLPGGGGFCGGQCFYDLPIAVSPVDASRVLIGGAGNGTCSRVYALSVDAGLTFTGAGVADVGLHADAHAIEFSPSNPSIVYEGNDGGIYRSNDGGATWTSLNTTGLSATQFQSLALHPTDAYFTIGGTQDNGTNHYRPDGTWWRIDFGDGGFTVIDQNTASVAALTMYHTYFNRRNSLVGFGRVLHMVNASDGNWTFIGNGANSIGVLENPNFYAPLVRGPGNPNTIYYGTDVLHRSTDKGVTNPIVSQNPIVLGPGGLGVPISTIAIAPTNDDVRLVALNNAQIWGTTTGSSALVNMTGAGMPPHFICRLMIDPTNPNVAYACYGGFQLAAGEHIWKTTNLMSGAPVWTASGNGLPDIPVNAIAIDPLTPSRLWAGTDVGVYRSTDGGANWTPYTTGMPVVAVFDMELQPVHGILRVATHGRGMFERLVDAPVATQLAVVGAEIVDGHPRVTWYSADGANERMILHRRAVPEGWETVGDVYADGQGMIVYEDRKAMAGHSYEYRIGLPTTSGVRLMGPVWVDVPLVPVFAIQRVMESARTLAFDVSVPAAGDTRIELLDVAGRRLESRDLSALGAGQHRVRFDVSKRGPGVYWVRLRQGEHMLSTRAVYAR